MRQNDGSEILGPNDPRNIVIGIIHVTPGDDRQSVLTAISTQEKLSRDQIILDLPAQNRAFKTALDFEGLHQMAGEIEASLVLIVPPKSKVATFANRQGFNTYYSLSDLVEAEFPPLQESEAEESAPATPAVDDDETDRTQTFPVIPPVSPPVVSAAPPATPQPVAPKSAKGSLTAQQAPKSAKGSLTAQQAPKSAKGSLTAQQTPKPAKEPLTIQQAANLPEPPTTSFPVEIPANSAASAARVDEDEMPTDPSVAAISATAAQGGTIAGVVVSPVDQPHPQDGTQVPQPGTGGALVPSNALPPVFYEPQSIPPQRSWRGLIITCIILLVVILVGAFFNRPILDLLFPPTATVTITPASQHVQHIYQVTGVLGVPDPTKSQVDARALYATSQTQMQTVKATGVGHTPGQQAQGILTFYNSSSSSQTVQAGTVIIDSNGLAVVNDDSITLPGLDPSAGIAGENDNAHTINTGRDQNIPANDFHTTLCCGGDIYVTNNAAFTGGQDMEPFSYVQQSDIDNVAQSMEATLAPQATAILQSQVRSNEAPAGTPRCAPLVKSNHQAGDKASTVTVSVTTTCVGEVYDTQAVQVLVSRELTQDASKSLGAAYLPVGQIQTHVTRTVPDNHGNVVLQVAAEGVWAYQFTSAQLKHLASLIAGKSTQDARSLLLSQPGVQHGDGVTITLTGVGATTIPDNTDHITIEVSAIDGLS